MADILQSKKTLALFDFDGTITTKDSFIPFMFFACGSAKSILIFILTFPYVVAYILKLCPLITMKEAFLKLMIRGWTREKFDSVAKDFYAEVIRPLVKQSAADAIRKHLADGADVSLVSASPEDWLRPFTEEFGINLIATRLEVVDGRYTGKILGNNCKKAEKVARVHERYDVGSYTDIYAYGDSNGDTEMLAMSNHPHYRFFK